MNVPLVYFQYPHILWKGLIYCAKVNSLLSQTTTNHFPLSDSANIISDIEQLIIYFIL